MMTSPTTTVASRDSLPVSIPSLLPVNPFVRRDLPAKNELTTFQVANNIATSPMQPDSNVTQQVSLTGSMDNVLKHDMPVPGTLETPAPGPLHNASTVTLMPNIHAKHEEQTEALDFSMKAPRYNNNSENTSSESNKLNCNTAVFSTGIKDPSSCTPVEDVMESAVDLSTKSEAVSSSTPRLVHDDKLVMLQQYNEAKTSRDVNLSDPACGEDSDDIKPPKVGTKRNRLVLDKMVQKLWKSKMIKASGESTAPEVAPMISPPHGPEPLDNDTSLGKVYVLNKLPVQIETYATGAVNTDALLARDQTEATSHAASLPEAIMYPLGAPLSGSTMNLTKTEATEESNEKGFCAIKFHTCRVCKQLFYSAEEMWAHAVTHQDFHKYRCNQCTYVTACHRELINHKQAAHGHEIQKNGRHVCNYPGCMRSYSEWRYLREHQRTHHHKQPQPQADDKASNFSTSPQGHQSGATTKNGRLICDYQGCFKTFKEWRHLKVHQTLHTGEKPLSCQLCNYACRHRSSMNWHMKSRHGLDKMKTQGNRTVYVDNSGRVVCGWSDEANREVNYLTETDKVTVPEIEIKPKVEDLTSFSEYSSALGESCSASMDNTLPPDLKRPLDQVDGSTSVSMTGSSRPPSCAPSENPSERSLMDDPHMLMLKMQAKPSEFGLNMAVQIEDLSPKEQMVGEDGRFTSKMSDVSSDKMSDKLVIDTSRDSSSYIMANISGTDSPTYAQSTLSSSLSSSEASSLVESESNRLVMTPVACSSLGQGSDHESSIMKFKLKYLVAPKYFPCKVCGENFQNAVKMWKHRIECHKDSTRFFCDSCGFDSPDIKSLQSHMMSTHGKEFGGKKPFTCFICGKGYATNTGLNQHLLRHSDDGPPPHDCPYENCTAKIHSKCALKTHIRRVHLNLPRKYSCPEDGCQRRFDSYSALSNHQVLHTGDRPLSCDFPGCDKAFRESKHLKVHKMQHTDEKPIKCDICDYSCRQRNSMNWHMKSKHNRVKSVSADGKTIYVAMEH